MHEQNSFFGFDEIYYSDTSGIGISKNGVTSDISSKIDNTCSYTYYNKNETTISYPYTSSSTGNTVVAILSPVFDGFTHVGFVMAEYSLEDFTQEITSSFGDDGYIVLTDASGYDLFSTAPDFIKLTEINNDNITDNTTIENILNNLRHAKGGSVFFVLDSVERIAAYEPLNINDWSIVVVMSERAISQDLRILSTVLIISLMSAFAALLIFLIHLWRTNERIRLVAYYDDLTGLPNLAKYKQYVKKMLTDNPKKSFVSIKMDVDNFKAINEVFNFDVGDEVLKAFAKTASTVTEPTFILARTGSDEFMMFSGNGFLEQMEQLIPHYEAFFKHSVPALKHHHITFNYGRYFIEPGETDVNAIVTKTSLAHSIAKTKKTHLLWDYDDAYKQQVLRLAEITNKMESALQNNEFRPFLQPKFSLHDNEIVGAEALVRWIEPDGNMVYPSVFIPLFETNGFIVELDKHILRSVCKIIRSWIDSGSRCVPISVNFSRIHLNNPKFVDYIIEIVDEYNVPHEYIEVELTETSILENEAALEKFLEDLRSASFTVSIDDFGTGYSSLGLLKNIKVDTLKLDRSFFINNKETGHGDLVIDGIIKLAHSIDMSIVAEGVEEVEQVEFLKRLNCESAQGYFFAKPMPIDKFQSEYIE